MANEALSVPAEEVNLNLPKLAPWFSQAKAIFGLAAALALGVGITMWAAKPDYIPVHANLAERDVAQVVEILRSENIPVRVEPGTGLVTVPSDQIRNARMKLASSGIANSGSVGFEMLQQDQGLGTSQFIETARYQHVLETELSRTISAMRNIDSARLHLALPKQSVFVRDRAKPSASVMVKLIPGRTLDDSQVESIIQLVASSVPYLSSSEVTVVDQWGRLMSTNGSTGDLAATQKQFKYARQLEGIYIKRIESLLTPIIGVGKVKSEVNVEVDFSSSESTQETFQSDPNKVRSEQIHESESTSQLAASGIPGALTNQPPEGGAINPENGANLQEEQAGIPKNINRDTTRNYELDKTIMHTRQASGRIQRLSVAVVVDDREVPAPKPEVAEGEEANADAEKTAEESKPELIKEPRTPEEIELIRNLVKEAVGYKEDRGDTVVVINRTFQPRLDTEIEPIPEIPIWEQPWVWTVAKRVLAGIIVLFMIFGIVKPAIRGLSPQAPTVVNREMPQLDQAENNNIGEDKLTLSHQNEATAALPPPPQVYGDILNLARAMANDDPKRVAKVVKDWVANDG